MGDDSDEEQRDLSSEEFKAYVVAAVTSQLQGGLFMRNRKDNQVCYFYHGKYWLTVHSIQL